MYQVTLTNEQTQLNFLVKQVLQGEEVIITDENGFHFKLISLLPHDVIQPKKQKSTENIFKKTAGILAHQKIDPLEWQRNIRNEWDRE